jgi:FkbM family methyltransferase
MKVLKPAARCLIRSVPFKNQLIRWGARLPPPLKCRAGIRLFSSLCRYDHSEEDIATNLGISSDYRLTLRRTTNSALLFGRPEDYRGESGPLLLARHLAPHCRAFIDVGAHLGYFVFYLRHHLPQLPIYFFEPNPQLFARISRHVQANRLSGVTGFQVAVGRCDGQADFYIDLSDDSSSSLSDYFVAKHQVKCERVDVVTFDRFLETHKLDGVCVKVDVESAEHDFIAGAAGALDRIRYLIMEVLGPASEAGFVQTMIQRHGFAAYYINARTLEHSTDGRFVYRDPEYNWLFCREQPAELRTRLQESGIRVASAVNW